MVGLLACVLVCWLIPSCGSDHVLTAITVSPQGATLIGPGVQVQYMAVGTFIHPPETKDVTDIVNWSSNSPQIVTITNTGLATSTAGCGTNLGIIATYYTNPSNPSAGNVVVGNATINVETIKGTCP
jgi:hypothetical protein